MGESDPGAVTGGQATNLIDSVGGSSLIVIGPAAYSSDVAPAATAHAGSSLSVNFTNAAFATNSMILALTNNFGVEAWVKPTALSDSSQIILYSGNPATDGWGLQIQWHLYQRILGGVATSGWGLPQNGTWLHVAMVCSNGLTVLYTNGVTAGTSALFAGMPNLPSLNFALATTPSAPGTGGFTGLVDEVRVFSFAPGQFSTNDLLCNEGSVLGVTNLVVEPAAGNSSVVLSNNVLWSAATTTSWLHLNAATQSGTTSTNVLFSYDANPGATRTGTITIGGQTLTVTQAGSNYVAAGVLTPLVTSGLKVPQGVAVDNAGNVYIADTGNRAIREWVRSSNTVYTLVSSGLTVPTGVAVDGAGNVYIADEYAGIERWSITNKTVVSLVSTGMYVPTALALDGAGNIFIANAQSYITNTAQKWVTAGNSLTNLFSWTVSLGLPVNLFDVAVDTAGNAYFSNAGDKAVREWNAAASSATSLTNFPTIWPAQIAVDGSGNLYMADLGTVAVEKWSVANNNITTLISNVYLSCSMAVDGLGNLYIAETNNGSVNELPRAFVAPVTLTESVAAGSDALPAVLPVSESLTGPFAPVSDAAWLTIKGVTNGVVNFSFPTNTVVNTSRTGHIIVLGQTNTIIQTGPSYRLGTTNILVGPAVGSNSVVLGTSPIGAAWSASTNATWLHLTKPNQGGLGSTNVIFSYDANPGATRLGTLTIAGQQVMVTQAGSTYVAANTNITRLIFYQGHLSGLAADSMGNVYYGLLNTSNSIFDWNMFTGASNMVVSLGSINPYAIALDTAGNIYFSCNDNTVREWNATSNTVTILFSSEYLLEGLAVDGEGNVYIAESGDNVVKKWSATNGTVSTLASTIASVSGVTVDVAGNVYFIESSTVEKWTAANSNVVALVSGAFGAQSLAVDGEGNIYFMSGSSATLKKWTMVTSNVTTLASELNANVFPSFAVDGVGNVFFESGPFINELPYAFVDTNSRPENASAGSDSLPVVLPATANLSGALAPASDSSWLTIPGVANGVVNFAFTGNTTSNPRTGHIIMLGESIAVTQAGVAATPPVLTGLQIATGGGLQFSFTNNPSASFSVWSSTNLALPFAQWTLVGSVTNEGSGMFQFGAPPDLTNTQRFYRVTAP